jgi:NitT/TauT family transport system substrate-binding protein
MEAFKNGDIDLSYLGSAPATLKRINDKTPIRVLAGANNVGSAIVVRSDLGIDSLEELAGKTIAIPGFGTVQDTLLRMVAEQVGLTIQLK